MGMQIPPRPEEKRLEPAPKEDRYQIKLSTSFQNQIIVGITIAFVFSGLVIFVLKICR